MNNRILREIGRSSQVASLRYAKKDQGDQIGRNLPLGQLFSLGSFLIPKGAQIFALPTFFPRIVSAVINFDKNGLG
jgi:hypothetical protein